MGKKYWLFKSEPGAYWIDDLARDGTTCWEGVRNYQARNFMRDDMRSGDQVLFYHSNAKPPGVVGIARVVREAYPDDTAWDAASRYHDPRSTRENPVWLMVDIEFVEKFPTPLPLDVLKSRPDLEGLPLLRRGQRLSIQPMEKRHFEIIRKLGKQFQPGSR